MIFSFSRQACTFIVLLLAVLTPATAQQKFRYNRQGLVTDPAFRSFLKKRGYQLAGAYDTVSKQPLKVYAAVVKNFRYGFIDVSGKEVVAPVYEVVHAFHDGKAVATRDGKSGLIDLEGQVVVPLQYDVIYAAYDGGYIFEQNGREGKMDADGRVNQPATKPAGKELTDRPPVNNTGEGSHAPFTYRAASNDYIVRQQGKQVGIVPNYGKPEMIHGSAVLFRTKEGKYGVVNFRGETILPFEYDGIWSIVHAGDRGYDGIFGLLKGKLIGVANQKGKIIIEPAWQQLSSTAGRNFRACRDKKCTFLDSLGRPLINDWYNDINFSYTMRLMYVQKDGKWAFTGTNGKLLTGFDYDDVELASIPPFIKVKQGGKFGALDTNLRAVLPLLYDELRGSCRSENGWTALCNYNYVYLKQGGKWGVLNDVGKLILPVKYDWVKFAFDDRFVVKEKGKWGFIKGNGKYIIPAVYDGELQFYGYLSKIRIDQKWGVIDSDGTVLLKPEQDYINYCKEEKGIIQVDIAKKTIFLDRYGNTVERPLD